MCQLIKPGLGRDQAQEKLSRPPGIFKKKRHIERLELFFLPSYIVDVHVLLKGERKTQPLCIDAVQGSFAFMRASSVYKDRPKEFRTCPFFLDAQEVQGKALSEYRRHLLRLGLVMRIKFSVEKIISTSPVYYPFWLGYFQRKGKVDFEVIDAVGGEHQGALMRSVFMQALLHEKAG